eukprot:12894093-Prorocentrum_lima.AAC.1
MRMFATTVSTGLMPSLTGPLSKVYPRHQWIGADPRVDRWALCEAVHGMASQTLEKVFVTSSGRAHLS